MRLLGYARPPPGVIAQGPRGQARLLVHQFARGAVVTLNAALGEGQGGGRMLWNLPLLFREG